MSFGVVLVFFVFLLLRARTHRSMVERDPEKFLTALTAAFSSRQDADRSLMAQLLYFLMSKNAVPIRLTALDVLAAKFQDASINAKIDLGKQQQQNQILFDFFSNALASIESFCCGSYFVGSLFDPLAFNFGIPVSGVFKKLRSIYPVSTLQAFEKFAPTSAFTTELRDCLDSGEWRLMEKMRNVLVHRVVPGRIVRISMVGDFPHKIDLDQWYEGDMTRIYGGSGFPEPTWAFELDDNCLVRQRDWIDKSIEGLAEHLTDLAKANGLG
jgi:hypothetical protein